MRVLWGLLLCFYAWQLSAMPVPEEVRAGARIFMARCLGCHSLSGMRAHGLSVLGILPKSVLPVLTKQDLSHLDPLLSRMGEANARLWFGAASPPDLTNEVTVRGAAWVTAYLLGFYADDRTDTGWNNTMLPGTQMPNPFFKEQGWRGAERRHVIQHIDPSGHQEWEMIQDMIDEHGVHHEETHPISARARLANTSVILAPFQGGTLSAPENARLVAQLVAFLCYVSDPSVFLRHRLACVILPLLCLLFILLFMLKKLYWRDTDRHD